MRRFVILFHEMPPDASRPDHFDLMIEAETALWTWALPAWPEPGMWMDVAPLPDHRLAYLEYEGPISGNRGRVTRRDAGTCEVRHRDQQSTVIQVAGQHLRGTLRVQYDPQHQRHRLLWQKESPNGE